MSKLAELIGNLNDRPCKTVDVPKRDGVQVGIWCLTLDENEQARMAAYKFVREVLKLGALDLEYDNQRAVNDSVVCELLARALRDPERPLEPFADSGMEIRQRLSGEEISGLFNEYLIYVTERAVLRDVEDPVAEVERLTELVRQNFPIAASLSHYASTTLRLLLLTALDDLSRSKTGMTPDSLDG